MRSKGRPQTGQKDLEVKESSEEESEYDSESGDAESEEADQVEDRSYINRVNKYRKEINTEAQSK